MYPAYFSSFQGIPYITGITEAGSSPRPSGIQNTGFSDHVSSRVYNVLAWLLFVNRYIPFGTLISNRAPSPGTPVSLMVRPVMAEDLPCQEETKSGVFPVPPLEDLFFLALPDPDPVILDHNNKPVRLLPAT